MILLPYQHSQYSCLLLLSTLSHRPLSEQLHMPRFLVAYDISSSTQTLHLCFWHIFIFKPIKCCYPFARLPLKLIVIWCRLSDLLLLLQQRRRAWSKSAEAAHSLVSIPCFSLAAAAEATAAGLLPRKQRQINSPNQVKELGCTGGSTACTWCVSV